MSNKLVNTYYDVSRISIWSDAKINEDAKHKARMSITFRNGLPRLTVYTGLENPQNVISYPCDYPTFFYILELLEKVTKSPAGTQYEVDSEGMKFVNGERTNEKIVVSTLHIGKTKEGVVYLAIIAPDRPKIVFPIKLSDFHKARSSADKQPIPEAEVSVMITMGMIRMLRHICSQTVMDVTNEEYRTGVRTVGEIKQAGGNTKSPAKTESVNEFDSDIPF